MRHILFFLNKYFWRAKKICMASGFLVKLNAGPIIHVFLLEIRRDLLEVT